MQNNPQTERLTDRDELHLPMLSHKFDQYFFHPHREDLLICLEVNQYPEKVKEYNLQSIDKDKQGDLEDSPENSPKKMMGDQSLPPVLRASESVQRKILDSIDDNPDEEKKEEENGQVGYEYHTTLLPKEVKKDN